ncbi:MAG: FAD-dependent thymidylate synthase [Nitrosopumilus sp.]
MVRETPFNSRGQFYKGFEGIKVKMLNTLDIDAQRSAEIVAAFYLSTWSDLVVGDGTTPRLSVSIEQHPEAFGESAWQLAERAMSGQVLPNTLETVQLTYTFENISRACTHQLVRTRVGAGFGQQGGRDNNWSEQPHRIPDTVTSQFDRNHIRTLVSQMRDLYKELIEKGVPYQDARYVLPMGTATNLVGTYNLLSLKGTLDRRLCNRMHPETNHVARLMADALVVTLPWVGKNVRSGCEKRELCASVSPMFPPSCQMTMGAFGTRMAITVPDNKILSETVARKGGYDWPLASNGTMLYHEIDQLRLMKEMDDPNICISLIDGTTVLTELSEGEWHLA